ncbi:MULTISPECIES: HaeIII family restriction endonuclease [unclassified Nostoc]|uniref:HaeIII family restriction endonuclease n=1 Tax=unclassified Nostoc TaxID=2593658 RepID=UPI00261CB5AC|nr:HaeIII family restriction endonuclease [Nostoc sp. S13]MDF5739976.1 HaeIII family restriction endonuclease [Nostoc sp. S13]
MSNLSNQQGRALEYVIVQVLQNHLPQVNLTLTALTIQKKDELHYRELKKDLQISFSRCAEKIYEWLENEFTLSKYYNQISIDRFTDRHGTKGVVADIQIELKKLKNINLSIKHHHNAVKHHRPARTAGQCGYNKNSEQDITFRHQYKSITNNFIFNIDGCNEFKKLDDTTKLELLYEPICKLVSSFINIHCQTSDKAELLLKFLIGNTNYYKFIYMSNKKQIIIQNFENLSSITSVKAESENQYVILTFSNNWIIKMRLHNAATIIRKNPDVKFDAKPDNIDVPEVILSM